MMISAPPCTLPWSPERLQYLRHFYPILPLACLDAQELKTVDVSILNAPDAPADLSTNLSIQSTCRDMVPNTSNALQTMTYQSSIASSGLLMRSRRSHSSGLIHLNF